MQIIKSSDLAMASKKSYKIPKQSSGVLFVDSLPNVEMKICRICKNNKPTSQFPYHSQHKDGFDSRCKECIKIKSKQLQRIRKNLSIKSKDNKCECCGIETESICVDHDHETEKFRGFLCHSCNLSIGRLGDTLEGVMRAANYLKMAKKRSLKKKNEKSDGLY